MSKKQKQKNKRDALWAEAKRLCQLSEEEVRMAKEMGLNPRSLIKNIPSKREPWKAPVKEWVRDIYRERQEKSARRRKAREERKGTPLEGALLGTENEKQGSSELTYPDFFDLDREESDFFNEEAEDLDPADWEFREFQEMLAKENEPPTEDQIADENRMMLRQHYELRLAAEYVAETFARVPGVEKVVLFGSVALPLKKEVPRFRQFRRAGVALWHECRDVDIAVSVSNLRCLGTLRRATGQALNYLLRDNDIGVAPHQVDIFIMDAAGKRYLGNLCRFRECPKGKPECDVPGCGATPFLRQYEEFSFDAAGLHPDKVVVLFDSPFGPDTGDDTTDDIPF